MEFKQLRYFVSVVTHRSFTRASEKLHIAQPALSRHIQLLEDEFGVQLLVRGSRGIETTDAGQRLKERADFILRYVADIKSCLAVAEGEPSGHVVVGVPPSLVSLLAPRLIEVCAQRHPKVTLRLVEGLSVFLAEWLDQGRLDLALLTDYGATPGLDRHAIIEEELIFVGHPDLLPARVGPIALSEIQQYPLIITHGFREVMAPWFSTQHVAPVYAMELDSIAVVKELLLQGRYCTVLPYGIVQAEVREGRLVAVGFSGPPVRRRIVLAVKANRPRSSSVSATERLVLEELQNIPLQLSDQHPQVDEAPRAAA